MTAPIGTQFLHVKQYQINTLRIKTWGLSKQIVVLLLHFKNCWVS